MSFCTDPYLHKTDLKKKTALLKQHRKTLWPAFAVKGQLQAVVDPVQTIGDCRKQNGFVFVGAREELVIHWCSELTEFTGWTRENLDRVCISTLFAFHEQIANLLGSSTKLEYACPV